MRPKSSSFAQAWQARLRLGADMTRLVGGWRLATARVGFRVWQVCWAHVGLFFATLALTVALTDSGLGVRNYWGQLNLWPVFVESELWENPNILLSFMTLRYVPNYFDILPMYMIVLLLMPIIMALAKVNKWLVATFILGVWTLAQRSLLEQLGLSQFYIGFPAEPWSDRPWFFNPFGWQLIFFTGFAFMRGWLPKPPVNKGLILFAAFLVLANIPLSNIGVREFGFDWAKDIRILIKPLIDKSSFGVLRYVHFLALAYLCWVAAGDKGNNLLPRGKTALASVWAKCLAIILKVGQQSLAVFVVSMFTARIMGFVMDIIGRATVTVLLVNLAGAAILVATAYGAGWFKSQPWKVVK